MKVKNYITDRLLIIGFYLLLCALSWSIFNTSAAAFITIISCITVVGMCYRVILVPLDLVIGKKTEYVYFSGLVRVERIEASSRSYCMEWKFYTESKKTLYLLNPEAYSFEDVYDCPFPENDIKIRITYWKLSKILLSWTTDTGDGRAPVRRLKYSGENHPTR